MLSNNLLASIIKHEEKEWNKIILVINIMLSNNLLSNIIKHEEKEWNKIIHVSKYCAFGVYIRFFLQPCCNDISKLRSCIV